MSKRISAGLENDQAESRILPVILLLGTGAGGKSTLFKQLRLGYTAQGLGNPADFRPIISLNIIRAIKRVYEIEFRNTGIVQEETRKAYNAIVINQGLDLWGLVYYNDKRASVGSLCKIIWDDPAIQSTFNRSRSFIEEPLDYYMKRIDAVCSDGYLPTVDDILQIRQRTCGVTSILVQFDGRSLKAVDVGGQRGERRKWASHFDGVTAILFVVSVGEFDMVLLEDDKVNRLHDALQCFEEVVNNEYFKKLNIILLLNKKDIFKKKIVKDRINLKTYFPEYEGKLGDYRDGIKFIGKKFETVFNTSKSQMDIGEQPLLKIYNTVGTDTKNVRDVFDSCRAIIMMNNVKTLI